jgi:hypothetical protein
MSRYANKLLFLFFHILIKSKIRRRIKCTEKGKIVVKGNVCFQATVGVVLAVAVQVLPLMMWMPVVRHMINVLIATVIVMNVIGSSSIACAQRSIFIVEKAGLLR